LEVTNISKFVSCIRLLFKKVLSDNFSGCYLRLFKLLPYCYSFASLASIESCYFFNISNCFFYVFASRLYISASMMISTCLFSSN
jgi:hypothetical protein